MRAGVRFGFMFGLGGVLTALSLTAWAQSIQFTDFTSEAGLTLNGGAKGADAGGKKVLRVTPAQENQAGSVFFTEKVALKDGFEATFGFQITGMTDGDADGLAFVIQNSGPKALGSEGSGLGYGVSADDEEGIPRSLAIEFDTFNLKDLAPDQDDGFGDPNGNHISVHSRGAEPNHVDEAYSLGKATEGLPNLKDGKPHTVKVSYLPGSLKVYVDSMEKPVLTVMLKLDSFSGKEFRDASVLDAEGKAWVGFTAGTGSLTENHDILNWKLEPRKAARVE
jgi:hypothetical protein